MQRYDTEELRQRISPRDILASFGLPAAPRCPCPLCGTSQRSQSFQITGPWWRCYACGLWGDAATLLGLLAGISRNDAIRQLAGEAGLPEAQPAAILAARRKRERREAARKAVWRAEQAILDYVACLEQGVEDLRRMALATRSRRLLKGAAWAECEAETYRQVCRW